MTVPRSTAKKLCTDTEYRLVNESFAPEVSQLTEKGLAQRIQRARTARDKYRSLAQRQTREARGRISPRGSRAAAGNKNTVAKQQLFDETLARYEKQAQRAGQTQAAARSTAGKKVAPAAKKTAASPVAAKPVTKRAGKKAGAAKKPAAKSAAAQSVATKPAAKKLSATKPDAAKATASKSASKPGSRTSSADATGKKKARRTPASRAGTITKPVKIPPLTQVVADVSHAVAVRKEEAQNSVPAPPARSPKAPAQTNDGAPPGVATVPAAGVNPKGAEFPRNPQERGRLGAAVKRQQARRDTR